MTVYYIIEGEVIDTYGGDFTYRDVWCEINEDGISFHEKHYGAKPSEKSEIDDVNEINYLKNLLK